MVITAYEAFWIYVILFFVSSAATIVIAWLLASRKKEPSKYDVFEAGQKMDVIPNEVGLFGSVRYFAYAMAFFVLDAFVWILLSSSFALKVIGVEGIIYLLLYLMVTLIALWFYLSRIMEVFRG